MISYQRVSRIRTPDLFTDSLSAAAIAAIEGSSVTYEDFTGGFLSQMRRAFGTTNWFDGLEDAASDPRSLKSITDNLYYQRRLRWRKNLTDIAVPGGQAYVVLSAAASETPAETAAVGAGSANGAIVATLAGDVGAASLAEVAGLTALDPKNLVLIREATSQDPILSSGRRVYGLLQAETGTVDGDTFNDTTKQVQISFVRQNAAGNDLEAVPSADIAGQSINYQYASRTQLYLQNEQDSLIEVFADPSSAAANTLQQAYLGGNTISVLTAEGNLVVDLTDDLTEFRILRNSAAFLAFKRDDTLGDSVAVNADDLDVNLTNPADFDKGIKVATGTQTVNVGNTAAGQIDSTSIITKSTTGDNTVYAADDVLFRTVRETTPLALDDGTAGAISALPGGPYTSVSAAIRAALLSADLNIHIQQLQNNYAADANVPGSGNGNAQDWSPALDLTNRVIDMNSGAIATVDTLIIYNGSIAIGGNGTTNNEVYQGTTPANGDLKWDFNVKTSDVILAISWAAV